MKLLSVVGARPQFVKLAPVNDAVAAAGLDHVIVHTGQHYDTNMSEAFFGELEIPEPDVNLAVGSDSHGRQTGAMLAGLDEVLERERPDWTVVYGDTNSTIAAALSAAKMGIRVAHVEAGLRSFNRAMPEEHNRVLTDHCADLLLAPTEVAMAHLADEGLGSRAVRVGDVMVDVFRRVEVAARRRAPFRDHDYVLATVHRQESTDDRETLERLLDALAAIPVPVVLAAHPRLRAKAEAAGLPLERGSIEVVEPLPYGEMVRALIGAVAVVTDSGGLQKEAFLAGRVCTTLRTETEWVETLVDGWNRLALDRTSILDQVLRDAPSTRQDDVYGTGRAAEATVDAIRSWP